jgi:hypothetical protein
LNFSFLYAPTPLSIEISFVIVILGTEPRASRRVPKLSPCSAVVGAQAGPEEDYGLLREVTHRYTM